MNRFVEDILRKCVSLPHDDRDMRLHLVELCIDNAYQAWTQTTLFILNQGWSPRTPANNTLPMYEHVWTWGSWQRCGQDGRRIDRCQELLKNSKKDWIVFGMHMCLLDGPQHLNKRQEYERAHTPDGMLPCQRSHLQGNGLFVQVTVSACSYRIPE